MSRIITIGREFGSGGRELGRRLAEELGYAYYNQEIVTEIAQRTALSEAYVHQILEYKPVTAFPIRIGRTFTTVVNSQPEQWHEIFRQQYQILMSTFETASSHMTAELRKMEVTLAQLPRTMDQTGVELDRLASALEKGTDAKSDKK